MKRKLKGFTLIECIIAMFVLAVSSLLLVQAYTQLVTVTRQNYTMYNSIGRQMSDAENPPSAEGKDDAYKAKKMEDSETLTFEVRYPTNDPNVDTDYQRTINEKVYVYVVSPFDMQGNQLTTGKGQGEGGAADSADNGTDSRYLYFHK